MAHPAYLREKARKLRIERRYTIDELAERLALSRSTIYYWVRDLPIPGSGPGGEFQTAAQRMGTRAMQRKYALRREEAYREGEESFACLCESDPTFRDFVCMYIGEGYKRDRNRVSISNSDPAVVAHATRWIRKLSTRPPFFPLQHHADQDPTALRMFWAQGWRSIRSGSRHSQVEQQSAHREDLAFALWRNRGHGR